ncbi:hypothetical protein KSP39_PZI008717 [Platanthera zijinensis]|uniref:Uncharacterized protein n=1 Tax=Platanthera zijinensis TaxID=2320716 RepID=A0AAP0BKD2_9ASPA
MRRLACHALMCGRLKSGDDFLLQRSINWWDKSYVDPHHRLVALRNTNTNRESVAYRSFRSSEFEARGVRKVTTGITGLWQPSVHSDIYKLRIGLQVTSYQALSPGLSALQYDPRYHIAPRRLSSTWSAVGLHTFRRNAGEYAVDAGTSVSRISSKTSPRWLRICSLAKREQECSLNSVIDIDLLRCGFPRGNKRSAGSENTSQPGAIVVQNGSHQS